VQGGQEFCRRHHLGWVAKPTKKTAVDTTPIALSFMADALSVATLLINLGLQLQQILLVVAQ